ncbi:MAG: CNNM domain-containing protein [Flavobacteriales bacterium]|nr:CNNM domain-containing protein [Flavobacteriales bacterium]
MLLLFFVLSITFSFLCSIWEAVLLSISPSYIERLKDKPALYEKLKSFKSEIDRPLSAILSLNTIAHTVGAIGVGAEAGKAFGTKALNLGFMELSYESIIAGLMTLAILIISEIIPKTIGANNWKSLTPFTVNSLSIVMFAMKPLVVLSQLITRVLKKNKGESVLSRSDFAAMTAAGIESGALEENESLIINNLLQLKSIRAKDIMTPRTMIIASKEDLTIKEFYDGHKNLRFSRVPIYQDKLDNTTGIVLKDDILKEIIEDRGNEPLSSIKRKAIVINNESPLPELFDLFMSNRNHLALVTDSYGSVVGVVTLEDVLETLLGLEIMDELDSVADLQELARVKWRERAKKMGLLPEEDA